MDDNNSKVDYDFELYKLLIDEKNNIHIEWINNFRIILTFNSILITASFALLVILAKGEVMENFIDLVRVIFYVVPFLGISISLLGIRMIQRLFRGYELRYDELRYIELRLCNKLPVLPYCEGRKKFSDINEYQKNEDNKARSIDTIESEKQKINGYCAYKLISLVFILAYISIFVFSFFIKFTEIIKN